MNYKLAKQLKDAGFPQPEEGILFGGFPWEKEDSYIPTLSELIDACGDGYFNLEHCQSGWCVSKGLNDDGWIGYFKTPKEAVGKLLLELYKGRKK